ncbi:MAG: HD domain-containing protein [Lachnospiraceae bacterium]|nr:HD domain-containing protein [Lachnospiraceae bacterium]
MKDNPLKKDNYRLLRIIILLSGLAVNVLLSYLTYRFNMPFYFDTLGTLFVTLIIGPFPGILCAVATNFFCSFFNPNAIFFVLLNIFVSGITGYFFANERYKKKSQIFLLYAYITLVCGILETVFQWILFGGPQFSDVAELSNMMSGGNRVGMFFSSLLIIVGLNAVDKGISIVVALILFFAIFHKKKINLRTHEWKQTPLTNEEKRLINSQMKNGFKSLRTRVALLLVLAAALLTIVMFWISVELHYKNDVEEYTDIAFNAAEFAADQIDPDMIEQYIIDGENAPGYKETEEKLEKIKGYFPCIKYLYAFKVKENGYYYLFDLDLPDDPGYEPGELIAFEEDILPQVDEMLAGEEIEPVIFNDSDGWLVTVYYPIRNSKGRTVAYTGVDVSMTYLTEFILELVKKAALVFSGFFILILGFGLWISGHYLVYPIGSMALAAEEFMKGIDNQDTLDDNVRKIRKLDIKTGDEVEKLYNAIADMAKGTSDQVREIRYYADATSKMQNGLIITMANMVENRDSDTGAHVQKTSAYVRIILDGLKAKGYYAEKLTNKYISDVEMSAPLHDVGKINISDTILNKPGKLTDEEYEIMKTHTTAGKNIMEQAISTVNGENYLKEARNMAAYHHERWDGKGYPEGLHGQIIPLSARVMAVADVFDALTSPRVYKPAFPLDKALEIIEEGSGTQFDPKCVEVFMDNLDKVKEVLKKYQDA